MTIRIFNYIYNNDGGFKYQITDGHKYVNMFFIVGNNNVRLIN